MSNPIYISPEPIYSDLLESKLTEIEPYTGELLTAIQKIRTPWNAAQDYSWYYRENEVRRIYDTMSMVEHDIILLIQQLNRIRKANWDLYYKEHPDEI